MKLGVGSYSITVATHENTTHIDQNYDWIDNAVLFKVIPKDQISFVGCVELQTNMFINKKD